MVEQKAPSPFRFRQEGINIASDFPEGPCLLPVKIFITSKSRNLAKCVDMFIVHLLNIFCLYNCGSCG